jgi:hypothetical protein
VSILNYDVVTTSTLQFCSNVVQGHFLLGIIIRAQQCQQMGDVEDEEYSIHPKTDQDTLILAVDSLSSDSSWKAAHDWCDAMTSFLQEALSSRGKRMKKSSVHALVLLVSVAVLI